MCLPVCRWPAIDFRSALEIDESYSLTLPLWKNLCHRWSRDQPRPGSLFQRPREEEKRDPGNEVDFMPLDRKRHSIGPAAYQKKFVS